MLLTDQKKKNLNCKSGCIIAMKTNLTNHSLKLHYIYTVIHYTIVIKTSYYLIRQTKKFNSNKNNSQMQSNNHRI